MDKKITGVVGYLTWIGLLVAYIAGDREGAKFHLNQSLVIWLAAILLGVLTGIASVLTVIPILGWIVAALVGLISLVGGIFLFICWIMGLIYAVQEQEKEVPILGKIKLLK